MMVIMIIIITISFFSIYVSCTKCRDGSADCYNRHRSVPVLVTSIIIHQSVSPIVKMSCPDVFCGVQYVLSVLELQTWDWHCFRCSVCV